LKKLNDVNLSDEKFLEVIGSCYNCEKINESDIQANLKEIFGEDKSSGKSVIFDTNLYLFPSNFSYKGRFEHLCYQRYFGYASNSLKIKSCYSLEELEDLIQKHKIIIIAGGERIEDYSVLDCKSVYDMGISDRIEQLSIGRHDILDLGIYKEWLLPIIRKHFTKEHVAKDILELTIFAKQQIENYHQALEQEKMKAEEIIASNDLAIGELEDFSEALNRIREKKD